MLRNLYDPRGPYTLRVTLSHEGSKTVTVEEFRTRDQAVRVFDAAAEATLDSVRHVHITLEDRHYRVIREVRWV